MKRMDCMSTQNATDSTQGGPIMESPEIRVKTKFGTLCAAAGADDAFPEIVVWLEDDENRSLMLTCVTDLSEASDIIGQDELRIAVWGDPKQEDYTHGYRFKHDELYDDNAMWA